MKINTSKLKAYFSGVVLYGLVVLIYSFFPYYQGFISKAPLNLPWLAGFSESPYLLIIHLYWAYVVLGLLWFLFYPGAKTETRTLLFWRTLGKIWREWKRFFSRSDTAGIPDPGLTKEETATALFFLVKFFFTPIMINFLFGNLGAVLGSTNDFLSGQLFNSPDHVRVVYFALLNLMLTIDTGYFVLGYLFEFKSWGNTLRSVEPTVFGWAVALACYPPFNGAVTGIIGWGSSDYGNFATAGAMLAAVYASLVLFFIYVWATVVLGLKSSNLTNRGIVSRGPYAYVRHPAYTSKNLGWLVMGLPAVMLNWWAGLSIILWGFIYFLRAITEERHLLADPDYQAYCKKVPYRFIPGVI